MFDYYEGKNIPENKKSYAVRLFLQDTQKTLSDKEIDDVMNKVIQELKKQLNAELR
jgi:phenylalanyl-tRNA synthetase beta chain